jgi:dTDP-4-amino-4,6-dideoxygalactose transaminase
MKIPALDMKAHLLPIRKEIDKAVSRVIDSGGFILGEEVKRLEQEVCDYTDSEYAIGVSNGTDAISLALAALDIKQGDHVLCPAFTYYATASAIVHAGAIPVFVDIDPKTYCISPDSVRDSLNRQPQTANPACPTGRRKPKVIIPVHLYGQCADMDAVLAIAKEHNLKIIEDTAQAFGAECKHQKAGTIGDCGTVSFFPGKNLGACGDAGMVLVKDKDIAERIHCLRNQGSDPANRYRHVHMGYNNRLDAIQAAVIAVKLRYLDKWNKQRAENAAYYNRNLADTGLVLPHTPDRNTHIYHQYTLRANKNLLRDKIIDYLQKKGVDARVFYPIPLHLQPCFAYLGYKKGDFPESENAADTVFSIPVYPELAKKQMDYVIESINIVL